jgi:hypothetical protein
MGTTVIRNNSAAPKGRASTQSGRLAHLPPQAGTDTRRSNVMRYSLPAAALALCMASGAAFAAAPSECDAVAGNQVKNCGFETGDFTNWLISGSANAVSQSYAYGVDALDPATGVYSAYFGTEGATPGTVKTGDQLTVTQNIALTEGLKYTLSFYIAQDTTPYTGYTNYFNATFDGSSLLTITKSAIIGNYTLETFTVTSSATGANTLAFSTQNDDGYWYLDDISLVEVPEPASLAIFGAGLTALGAMAYRRRRAS